MLWWVFILFSLLVSLHLIMIIPLRIKTAHKIKLIKQRENQKNKKKKKTTRDIVCLFTSFFDLLPTSIECTSQAQNILVTDCNTVENELITNLVSKSVLIEMITWCIRDVRHRNQMQRSPAMRKFLFVMFQMVCIDFVYAKHTKFQKWQQSHRKNRLHIYTGTILVMGS